MLFRAINAGSDTLDSQLEIRLPDGWSILSQPGPAPIAPGASLNRLIAFHVPKRALPEIFPLSVAFIRADGDTLDTAQVVFRVAERRAVRVAVLAGPSVAATTQPYGVRFAVLNDGNTHETVDLNGSSSLGHPVHLDADRVRLAPFSAAEVEMRVDPLLAHSGRQPHTVRLSAQAEGADGAVISYEALLRTDMIPEGRDPTDTDPTIPVEVGIIASGTASDVGRQVAVSVPDMPLGGGRLQIGLRGPYMRQTGPFDQQDLYSASYEHGSTRIDLGDHSFRQTWLTEYGTYGFGAQVSHRWKRASVKGYAMRTRFRFPDRSQAGLSASYDPSGALTIRVNGLARRDFADARLASVDGEWRFGRRSFAQAEYGIGSYAGEPGSGVRLQVTHVERLRRLDVRYQSSTAAFPGSARGTRIISATGSHEIGSLAAVDAAFGQTRRAVDFNRYAPTVTGHARIGGSLRLPTLAGFGASATLSGEHRYREGHLAELTRSESFAAGSLALNRSAVTARITVDRGQSSGPEGTASFTKSDLTFFIRRNNTSLSGSWIWESGPRMHYPRSSLRQQWNLSADVRWSGRIRTELDLYVSAPDDRVMPGSRYLNGAVEFSLPYGHRLSVRARVVQTKATSSTYTDVFGGFAYSIPVTIPARIRDTGIFGHVVDARSGRPVRGALVSLGDHAVLTDEAGGFRFSGSARGSRLVVDPGPEGAGLVVMNPAALAIDRHGRPLDDLEIALAPGAKVDGRIEIERARGNLALLQSDVSDQPLGGIVVVARDGSEERFAMSRSDGRFAIDGLAPGEWTLEFMRESVPGDLVPVSDSVVVRLGAGETLTSALRFRPKTRPVRIVGSSSLSLADAATAETVARRQDPVPDVMGDAFAYDAEADVPEAERPAARVASPVTGATGTGRAPSTSGSSTAASREPAPAGSASMASSEAPEESYPTLAETLPAQADLRGAPPPAPIVILPDSGGPGFPWWILLALLLLLAEARRRVRRSRVHRRRTIAASIRDWPGPRPPVPPQTERRPADGRPPEPRAGMTGSGIGSSDTDY